MESKPLITISGPPASGTSTLSERLAERLNFEVVSGGKVFRNIADDKSLSLQELNKLAEEDESIDKELDERLKNIIKNHASRDRNCSKDGLIVESRLAGHHGEEYADLCIYVDAEEETRAGRIGDRDEALEELVERENSERRRYKEHYGIDIKDTSVYDLLIETDSLSISETVDVVLRELDKRGHS